MKKKCSSGKLNGKTLGNNKAPLSALPPSAQIHAAMAMNYGNEKYGFYNFRGSKVSLIMYIEAIDRHKAALLDGEDYDPDSGELHASHIMAGAAIIIDAKEHGNLVDDRPPRGEAPRILKEAQERIKKRRGKHGRKKIKRSSRKGI